MNEGVTIRTESSTLNSPSPLLSNISLIECKQDILMNHYPCHLKLQLLRLCHLLWTVNASLQGIFSCFLADSNRILYFTRISYPPETSEGRNKLYESAFSPTERIKKAIIDGNAEAVPEILDANPDVLETKFDHKLWGADDETKGLLH